MKFKRYITPLSVLTVVALLYGLWCVTFSDKHGWLAMAGLVILLFVFFPSLILNVILNKTVNKKGLNTALQLVLAVVIIVIHYYRFGNLGMPFLR